MNDFLDYELDISDDIGDQEINVRERCQQFGISLDNVRYRVGIDRFKWLCLTIMLKFKMENNMLDNDGIERFFQYIIPKIPRAETKNPLACVLVFYSCITESIEFKMDETKLNYIEKDVIPNHDILFRDCGLKFIDLVRYIRLFQSLF